MDHTAIVPRLMRGEYWLGLDEQQRLPRLVLLSAYAVAKPTIPPPMIAMSKDLDMSFTL